MVKLTDERACIYEVQCALRVIASVDVNVRPKVVPDGIYGERTREAVESFQKCMGLPATGVVDYATWQVLFAQEYECVVN